jgi:ketosteroid isomerase-like protein
MRRLSALPAALVVALVAAACAPKDSATVDSTTPPAAVAASAADPKADADSIAAINARWLKALVDHDTVTIGSLFADDGKSFAPNQAVAKGPAGATAAYAGLYRLGKDVKLTFQTSDLAVAQAGDLAVERGTYQLSWTDAKGKPMSDKGNYVVAWKKVAGQWKVLADMNASDMPMPGM